MRWSPKPLEIGPLDGFGKTDLFDYREFGEHLAKLIGSLEDNPVLVLDGPWGSGKTTFARQLAGVLRKQGHAVAYFDAFATDHHKDPFLALVEEVHCLATKADVEVDSDTLPKFTRATVAVAKELGLTTVEGALPPLGRLLRLAVEAGSQADAPLLEDWLEQAAARKEAIADFRDRLSDIAEALTIDSATNKQEHVTTSELGKSVLKVYGDVDETRYLEKFFEIVVRLPESTPGGHRLTTRAYVHHLSKQLRFPRNNAYGHRYLDFLCALAEAENLSLRSLEHTMRLALVLAPSAPPKVVALLPILRVARPKLFDRVLQMAQEPLTAEEKSELGDLANHLGRDARDSLLQELEPNGQLAYFARVLDQYRVD